MRHQGTCDAGPCGTLPAFGCCFDDDACSAETRCVGAICQREREEAGTCVTRDLDPGECWDDGDCTSDTRCHGAERCPCAHACLLPDEPGTCEPFIGLPPDPVE
ncbi:MAG: hypothetical protein EA398_11725 [Deltaproteobacteria bacterium]|nr:MAG: hypothetical protein EA398_11725 [Deltaproteobacteria bacterium]